MRSFSVAPNLAPVANGREAPLLDRTILHCDCNAFFASVECLLNPQLRDVPMAVAGNPENRHGIILAKNELAKKCGVVTAETIWQAKKKCPDIVLVPPRHGIYEEYSKLVNKIYNDFTDLVEPFGIDESYLDVTGVRHIFGSGKEIADKIRTDVKEKTGLTVSVGVSFNKIFAKLGSDYKKPDATTVISRENFKDIVFPLPASDLLFVGKSVNAALGKIGIQTIGELASCDKTLLKLRLGKMGEMIWEYANGLDDSPVKSAGDERDMKSVGNGMTFKRNLVGLEDIRTGVAALADEVAYRMRKYGVKCSTVSVSIKDPNFKSISRQKTLDCPTHLAKEIADSAMELIKSSWSVKAPIRTLTVTGANLTNTSYTGEQLTLFEDAGSFSFNKDKQERLETAIDKIRDKHGKDAVSTGNLLQNDLGIGSYKNDNG